MTSIDLFNTGGGEAKKKAIPPNKYRSLVAPPAPTKIKRDNTSVVIPSAPVNNTDQAIVNSKQATAINQMAQEKDAYYNPELRKGITSGDKTVDFLYNHQGLMDVPIVGDIIKKQAYEAGKRSGGYAVVDPKKLSDKSGYNGSGWENDGPKLLDVYFGKQTLPQSAYKPTDDYMPFLPSYSLKTKDNLNRLQQEGKMQSVVDGVIYSSGKITPEKYDYKSPIYTKNSENSELSNLLGVDLGGHKTGIGFDKEKGLPYVSISDAWDFEPNSYSKKWGNDRSSVSEADKNRAYIEASLMHKAGKPFKVYDRFYFDPKTKQYIPDDKLPISVAKYKSIQQKTK